MNGFNWLDGKKTIIGVIGWGILLVAKGQGWVGPEAFTYWAAGLTAWTGFALRHAIEKSAKSDVEE